VFETVRTSVTTARCVQPNSAQDQEPAETEPLPRHLYIDVIRGDSTPNFFWLMSLAKNSIRIRFQKAHTNEVYKPNLTLPDEKR
jgi:hypothetical protein